RDIIQSGKLTRHAWPIPSAGLNILLLRQNPSSFYYFTINVAPRGGGAATVTTRQRHPSPWPLTRTSMLSHRHAISTSHVWLLCVVPLGFWLACTETTANRVERDTTDPGVDLVG